MFNVIYLFIFITASISAQISFSYIPIREISGLRDPQAEVVSAIKAHVVVADYALIRKDFNLTKRWTENQIDDWLISEAAYLSIPQIRQERVNTPIKSSGERQNHAYRPYAYGRALVFDTGHGLIDAKGVGSINPMQASHGNGLATLGEVIREFAYEKLVKSIFSYSGSEHDTVGSYAVLAFEFQVRHNNDTFSPAGAILRQAHDRYENDKNEDYNFLPAQKAREIELLLRKFGITSAGTVNEICYMADLQGTKSGAVVDFGTFLTMKFFEAKDVCFFVSGDSEQGSIDSDHPDLVQPAPSISVPWRVWGSAGDQESKFDNPRQQAELLARQIWRGLISREKVEYSIYFGLLGPVYYKWFKDRLCSQSFCLISDYLSEILGKIMRYYTLFSREGAENNSMIIDCSTMTLSPKASVISLKYSEIEKSDVVELCSSDRAENHKTESTIFIEEID